MAADLILAAMLLGLFAVATYEAIGLPWQAAVAPLLATVTGLGLAILLIGGLLLKRPGLAVTPHYDRTDVASFGAFLGAVAAVVLLGFKVGGALFVFGYLRLVARRRLLTAALCALAVPLVVGLLVEGVLGTRLFAGFAFRRGGW